MKWVLEANDGWGGWIIEPGDLERYMAVFAQCPNGRLITPKQTGGMNMAYEELVCQRKVRVVKRYPNGDVLWEKA